EPFTSEDFRTFRSELVSKISDTPHPLEVTITELIPRLGHALADLRASSAETTAAFKQAISAQQVDIERLHHGLERAVIMLSESIERRDRADEGRAQVQQVVMSSICALAGASSTLQSTHTHQHEQQQQTLQMLVRLLATSTLPALADPSPPISHSTPSTSAPSSSTPVPPLPMRSQEDSAAAASIASDTKRPSASFQPPPMPTASSVPAASSAPPPPLILLPRTILCIAAKVNTVSQLAVEWYAGKDGYMGVLARLEAKDQALDAKGAAARKQICRWRRVLGVLEELERDRGWSRDTAARAMDTQLKKNKHGLRTLADNIAKDDARAAWMALLVAAT
ncbi:hypothetical protein A4X13_0g9069, partial [Tilletia indica]